MDDLLSDPLDRPIIDANIRYDVVCRNWMLKYTQIQVFFGLTSWYDTNQTRKRTIVNDGKIINYLYFFYGYIHYR
jgi:hypothetical protein